MRWSTGVVTLIYFLSYGRKFFYANSSFKNNFVFSKIYIAFMKKILYN